MLIAIKIRNFAIIEEVEVNFKEGLNIISGETGAGKSIVIQAISLLIGERASSDLIRKGEDHALVEGLFDIEDNPKVRSRLEELSIDIEEDNQLLIKRVISQSGRHRIYINGEIATLKILEEITDGIVDLCAQHEHQSLLKPATQMELLDRYGGLERQVERVQSLLLKSRGIREEFDHLRETNEDRMRKADFLRFQIEELRKADLKQGEDEELREEKKRLQSTKERLSAADQIRQGLEDESSGVMNQLHQLLGRARSLAELDNSTSAITDALQRAMSELEELDREISTYLAGVESQPERLSEVEERLAELAHLKRKYGADVSEMIFTQEKLESELDSLDGMDGRIEELESELQKVESELLRNGKKLSQSRRKIAEVLSGGVTSEIRELRMADAEFRIALDSKEVVSEWTPSFGGDEIQFKIKTNAGEEAKSLGKVASGGELSRLMLSIRRVISDRGGIGVYLFDEIDSGIGGQTAFVVGKKLSSVSKYNQVICITHLPQIAAFADQHLIVAKFKTAQNRTVTEVVELKKNDRKEEIARMLGGPKLNELSLKNAADLMKQARSQG